MKNRISGEFSQDDPKDDAEHLESVVQQFFKLKGSHMLYGLFREYLDDAGWTAIPENLADVGHRMAATFLLKAFNQRYPDRSPADASEGPGPIVLSLYEEICNGGLLNEFIDNIGKETIGVFRQVWPDLDLFKQTWFDAYAAAQVSVMSEQSMRPLIDAAYKTENDQERLTLSMQIIQKWKSIRPHRPMEMMSYSYIGSVDTKEEAVMLAMDHSANSVVAGDLDGKVYIHGTLSDTGKELMQVGYENAQKHLPIVKEVIEFDKKPISVFFQDLTRATGRMTAMVLMAHNTCALITAAASAMFSQIHTCSVGMTALSARVTGASLDDKTLLERSTEAMTDTGDGPDTTHLGRVLIHHTWRNVGDNQANTIAMMGIIETEDGISFTNAPEEPDEMPTAFGGADAVNTAVWDFIDKLTQMDVEATETAGKYGMVNLTQRALGIGFPTADSIEDVF